MKLLEAIDYADKTVRVAGTAEEPLFCGVDVARCLGYSNPGKAVRDHCKGGSVLDPLSDKADLKARGRRQPVKFIPESDLYRLILRSKAPNAEAFQDWVCEEVLPAIRRKGAYSVGDMPQTYPEAMRMLGELLMQGKTQQEALSIVWPKGNFGEVSDATGKPKTRLIAGHYRTPHDGRPDSGAMRLQKLQCELPLFGSSGEGKGAA